MKRFLVMMMCAMLSLAGCSVGDKTQAAETGVVAFHKAMDAGQHAAIYDASAADMKSATTKDEFIKLLGAMHKKLGAFKSGKTTGWNVNATAGGTYVTLVREAQFEHGPGTENFVFRMQGQQAVLAGYHINSNVLITG